jgi:hypothetical protein
VKTPPGGKAGQCGSGKTKAYKTSGQDLYRQGGPWFFVSWLFFDPMGNLGCTTDVYQHEKTYCPAL